MDLSLCHDSAADALREVVMAAGGFKVVGSLMFPEFSAEHAAGKLRDCLNVDRREKLSIEQIMLVIRIGRQHGCHALINHLARDGGYADPLPVDADDEKTRLQREFCAATKSLQAMASRIEAITATSARRGA